MTTAKKNESKYIAVVGLNYPSTKDGKPRRVEPGDTVIDMPPTSLKNEVRAGNIIVEGDVPDTDEKDEEAKV